MRKLLLIIFPLVIFQKSHAQTPEIDSLKNLLQKEKTDTGRVLLLRDISLRYLQINPDSSMQLALEELNISRRIGFKKGEAIGLNSMATVYLRFGNNVRALQLLLEALAINEKIKSGQAGRNLNNIANIYRAQENYRQALNFYIKANSPFESLSLDEFVKKRAADPELQKGDPVVISNIGRTYFDLKMLDSAWFFAQMTYDQALKNNSHLYQGISLTLMGEINAERNFLKPAIEYYRLSINEFNTLGSGSNNVLWKPYFEMAKLFQKMQLPDSAFYYARQATTIASMKKLLSPVIETGEYLAGMYKIKGNADSALFYFELAKAAKDSVFSSRKISEVQSLLYDEKLRQQDMAAAKLKAQEERNRNLQYAAIAIVLVIFLILYFVFSHSVIANSKLIRFLGILTLLIVFEFINLYIHPYLDKWTDHSIPMMLGIMVCIAALLIPLHHKLEHWITHKLVEKNNKIKLAAARKTIARLEKVHSG